MPHLDILKACFIFSQPCEMVKCKITELILAFSCTRKRQVNGRIHTQEIQGRRQPASSVHLTSCNFFICGMRRSEHKIREETKKHFSDTISYLDHSET
jgi:hypothetical protein